MAAAAAFGCAPALGGCGSLVSKVGGWFKEDEAAAALADFTPALAARVAWSRSLGAAPADTRFAPLVADDIVVACDARGRAGGYAPGDGRRLWSRDLDIELSYATGGGRGLAVAGAADGEVVAFAAADGEPRWRRRLSAAVVAVSAAHRGRVAARTADDRVHMLRAADGALSWSAALRAAALTIRGAGVPVFYGDALLVGGDDGRVAVFALRDGAPGAGLALAATVGAASLDNIDDIDGRLAVADGTLFASAYQGPTAAFELDGGRVRWSVERGSAVGPAVGRRRVYLPCADGVVRAFQRGTGRAVWSNRRFAATRATAAQVAQGRLVVGDAQGYLYWLAAADGAIAARLRIDSSPVSALATTPDGLLALTAGGKLALVATRPL